MSKKSNFIFWGTPDVASKTLEILKENGFTPSLVITSRDMPQGRKMIVTPPPAKVWAEKNNIPYIQPEKLDTKEVWDVLETNTPDLFIVVAYGKIMPENIINMPKLGSLNIHYSLLPKYRGASPVESAILNGDTKTGITIQKMQFEMDKGPIVAEEIVSILSTETAPELRARLIKIGAELLVKTLPDYLLGKTTLHSQDESLATYCKKIKKEDGLINLKDNEVENYNKFRAYALWPRTFFFENGKRIIITKARLENDKFIIEKIIPENGKEKDYKEITSSNP